MSCSSRYSESLRSRASVCCVFCCGVEIGLAFLRAFCGHLGFVRRVGLILVQYFGFLRGGFRFVFYVAGLRGLCRNYMVYYGKLGAIIFLLTLVGACVKC